MHIKFLAHGTGSGTAAANYLLGEKDHLGHVRAEVRVIRGDPVLTGQLIDSLKFVQRYTSGVVAWTKEDAPTDQEINQFIDDFERTAFAGLGKNQYDMTVVMHVDDDGSKHLHILVPRVDLQSGKSLNIAPPGWEKTFDPLRDFWNHSKGWARPDDPARARLVQPGPMALASKHSASDVRQALALEPDPKVVLTRWLHGEVLSGQINDRTQLIAALESVGTINRIADNSISIRLVDGAKPIRLKGEIYDSSFDANAIREAERKVIRSTDEKAIRQTDRNIISSTDNKKVSSADRKTTGATDKRESANTKAAAEARAELETRIQKRAEFNRKKYPCPKPSDKAAAAANEELDRIHKSARNDVSADKKLSEELANDGNRNDAIRAIKEADRAAAETNRSVVDAVKSSVASCQSTVQTVERFDRLVNRIKVVMDEELERFKSDISLVDFAQAHFGYELVKRESSQASKVIKAGGDKLVVSRRDGHDVYFSVGDDSDSGSIIDFVQKRLNKSLGHVRKMLRQWLPGSAKPAKRKPAPEASIRPVELPKDRAALVDGWQRMKPYQGAYLSDVRGLDPELIAAFDVRQDARGNACFRHRGPGGETSGWEVKNQGFTGFAAGGERALMVASADPASMKTFVILEASIDAISYAQMRSTAGDVYISMGGEPSAAQMAQLKQMIDKNPDMAIVLAHDGDAAGDTMANKVQAIDPARAMERDRPPEGQDWNDVLRSKMSSQTHLQK